EAADASPSVLFNPHTVHVGTLSDRTSLRQDVRTPELCLEGQVNRLKGRNPGGGAGVRRDIYIPVWYCSPYLISPHLHKHLRALLHCVTPSFPQFWLSYLPSIALLARPATEAQPVTAAASLGLPASPGITGNIGVTGITASPRSQHHSKGMFLFGVLMKRSDRSITIRFAHTSPVNCTYTLG
ncbi:MAG: hypothetical protein JWR35_3896, partial [Marmoricola sp.]|nr:hypothetical protein [Marmoricola sp.]